MVAGDASHGTTDARTLARAVITGLVRDHSFHYAAATAFRVALAVFPLLLAIISVATLTGSADRIDDVLAAAGRTDAVPGTTIDAIRSQLDDLDEPGPNHVIGAIVAFGFALWSSAAAFRTVMSGLNRSFEMHDRAGLVRRFFVSLGLALVTAALATAATLLVAEGPVIERLVESLPGGSGPLEVLWDAVRFPVIAVLVFAWLAITYAFAPADRRSFRFVTPGIVLAFLLWLAFALLFSWYVDAAGSQRGTYGSFAGLVAFQLYMYWSALIVFVGAQVDNALGQRGEEPSAS